MVRVGTVQAEPVWFDLQATVQKTINLIDEAGQQGINVLAFPEVWIPGYPLTLWTQSVYQQGDLGPKYMANSLPLRSPEIERIRAAAKESHIFVILGYSERDGGSIYMAQTYISEEGEIVAHRRKIKPTHVERSLWGDGQGNSLDNVVDTSFGRIGALNCFEHYQPLLRYYEYSQRVQIHIAAWPVFIGEVPPGAFQGSGRASQIASQFFALEGQAFVLVASQVVRAESLELLRLGESGLKAGGGGFAMIFGPNGKPLVEALPDDQEGILQADIDLEAIGASKYLMDPVGHYSRPDMLALLVNTKQANHVVQMS